VKYSLIAPNVDSRTGMPYANFQERFFGTLLVRVLADRTLKLEVFPNRTADQVGDFTPEVRTYER
jgi:hypothetical protein